MTAKLSLARTTSSVDLFTKPSLVENEVEMVVADAEIAERAKSVRVVVFKQVVILMNS